MVRHLVAGTLVALSAAAGSAAPAATLRVPSEYATIQAAIDAAVSGDTVLVGPGTYTNCDTGPCTPAIAFMKSGVSLVGEMGADATTLRIDTPAGGLASVQGHGVAGCLLEGFTIAGTAPGYRGAVFLGSAGIVVRNCVFYELDGGVPNGGGAIKANIADIRVEDSKFIRCAAGEGGGIVVDLGNVELVRSLFEECAGGGASLGGHSSLSALVLDCTFRNNTQNSALAVLDGYHADIVGNLFEGNSNIINSAAITVNNDEGTTLVQGNVFVGNDASAASAYGMVVSWKGPGAVSGNSFVGNETAPGWPVLYDATELGDTKSMTNNIFAHNEALAYKSLFEPPDPVGCNLFWENTRGDYQGYVPAPTDLFVDPLLCDPTTGDVTLQAGSPCLPENSNGCGLIGAAGLGCGTVSVEDTSWGKVKAGYRKGEVR